MYVNFSYVMDYEFSVKRLEYGTKKGGNFFLSPLVPSFFSQITIYSEDIFFCHRISRTKAIFFFI